MNTVKEPILEKLVDGFCKRVPMHPSGRDTLKEYFMAFADHVQDKELYELEINAYSSSPKNIIHHDFRTTSNI